MKAPTGTFVEGRDGGPMMRRGVRVLLCVGLPLFGLLYAAIPAAHAEEARRRGAEQRHDRGAYADHREGRGRRPAFSYAQPVYAPVPEYYQPPVSPGISLFLPFDLRR